MLRTLKILFSVLFFLVSDAIISAQEIQTVVIDAGHGGKDPGTLARKHKHKNEKHIALAIAKNLGRYIEKNYPKIKVIYTRKRDIYLTLNQRAKIANKANADLFISIHVDASASKKAKGASVYVLGLHRTEDNLKVAMRENAVMLQEENYETNYAGFDPQNPESYIIFSLMQNQYLNNSMVMAGLVDKYLKTTTKRKTKGVKQAGFYVLREVGMPSVLIETGYITNTSDADYLCSAKGQNKTALAIFNAFKDYKAFLESHTIDLKANKAEETKQTNTYFTVQVLFSRQDIASNSKRFRALSPIFKHKKKKGYYYTFGRTQDYKEALKMQKKARKVIPDSYLIGIHNGKIERSSKVRSILSEK